MEKKSDSKHRRLKNKLVAKYFLSFFIAVILPYWIAGTFVLSGASKEITKQVETRYRILSGQISRIIENEYIEDWLGNLTFFSSRVGLSNFPLRERELISSYYLRSSEDVLSFSIYNSNGDSLISWISPEIASKMVVREYNSSLRILVNLDEDLKKELIDISQGGELSDAVTIPEKLYMEPRLDILAITMGSNFRLQDRSIGCITMTLSLTRLRDEIQNLARSLNVDIVILDDNGRLILHSDPKQNYIYPKPNYKNVPSIKEFLYPYRHSKIAEAQKGIHLISHSGDEEFVLESLKQIGVSRDVGPWILWTRQRSAGPAAEFMQGSGGAIIQWAILGILLAAAGGLLFSLSISKPLGKLLVTVRKIAGGDYDSEVDMTRNDELGELAEVINDIGDLLRKNQAITLERIVSEKQKTEAIVRSMADGLLVIDSESNIAMMNSTFEDWFGLYERNVVGQLYTGVLTHIKLKRHISEILSSSSTAIYTTEIDVTMPINKIIKSLQIRSVRPVDHHNRSVGVVLVLRDITREKKIDQMKSELVSTVSHELRTPITSIQGFSEILLEEELNDEEKIEFNEIIHLEAKRLGALISNFLDLSRIESGELAMKMKSVNLRETVEAAVDVIENQAQEREITIHLDFPDQAVYIIGDRDMLEQVFINLLSNGVKYNRVGSDIFVIVKLMEEIVTIEVKDTGYGIPEEALPHIFNKFYRVDMSSTAKMRGTGLGLAIVKEIVERHGGNTEVESIIGSGSTFKILLPRYGA